MAIQYYLSIFTTLPRVLIIIYMKKLSKLRLKNVDPVELSKDQMKGILGATGCSASSCAGPCSFTMNGLHYSGSCGWDSSSDYLVCGCQV